MSSSVYLGIGSNSGDRCALIGRAVAALINVTGAVALRESTPFHSEPWGFCSPNEFLNIVVELEFDDTHEWTCTSALALLDALQELERSISSMPHRNVDGTYRDRELDIDIVAISGFSMASPRLTVPHPLAAARDFVVEPLRELVGKHRTEALIGPCTL